jgi:NADH:ubiquinone oxidoreductase subunit 6 (subunit J)
MRTKTLTFKAPDKMKVIVLIFAVAFVLSPGVRVTTANTLYSVADIISSTR